MAIGSANPDHVRLFPVLITILRGKKVKQLVINYGFSIGYLCSIRSTLLDSAQTCQLFENELVATLKRSKETNYDFIASFDLLSILISNAIQMKGR